MSDVGIGILLFVGVMGLVGLIRFLAWLTDLKDEHGSLGRAGVNAVKKYVEVRPRVMLRSEDEDVGRSLSDLRQTEPQTDRPTYNRVGMIDIYKLMRKYGIPREEARAALQAAALPLDNNQWTKVAPRVSADDAPHVTPIVGRPTSAKFETDADYPYRPIEG